MAKEQALLVTKECRAGEVVICHVGSKKDLERMPAFPFPVRLGAVAYDHDGKKMGSWLPVIADRAKAEAAGWVFRPYRR